MCLILVSKVKDNNENFPIYGIYIAIYSRISSMHSFGEKSWNPAQNLAIWSLVFWSLALVIGNPAILDAQLPV